MVNEIEILENIHINVSKLNDEIKTLKNTIEKQQQQIQNLQQIKEQVNQEEDFVPDECWRGKVGDTYYFLGTNGRVMKDNHYEDSLDDDRYNTGNYFRTKEQAENYSKWLQAANILRREIAKRNEGWSPDFNKTTEKNFILIIIRTI